MFPLLFHLFLLCVYPVSVQGSSHEMSGESQNKKEVETYWTSSLKKSCQF